VDVLVDAKLRPWLIEINEGPALAPVLKNELATASREAVVNDVLTATLDPILAAGCVEAAAGPGCGAWETLAEWSGAASDTG